MILCAFEQLSFIALKESGIHLRLHQLDSAHCVVKIEFRGRYHAPRGQASSFFPESERDVNPSHSVAKKI
jgi:hypothetical protein